MVSLPLIVWAAFLAATGFLVLGIAHACAAGVRNQCAVHTLAVEARKLQKAHEQSKAASQGHDLTPLLEAA